MIEGTDTTFATMNCIVSFNPEDLTSASASLGETKTTPDPVDETIVAST